MRGKDLQQKIAYLSHKKKYIFNTQFGWDYYSSLYVYMKHNGRACNRDSAELLILVYLFICLFVYWFFYFFYFFKFFFPVFFLFFSSALSDLAGEAFLTC
jgi:hypothetical protein